MAKTLLIGIHGLANKPPCDELAKNWKSAIQEGLRKNFGCRRSVDFRLVYWADLLYRQPLHRDKRFDFDALFNTEPYYAARRGTLRRYEDAWTDRARRMASRAVGAGFDLVEGALGIDRLGNAVLRRKMRDMAFYFDPDRLIEDRGGVRRPVRDVLRDDLRAALEAARGHRVLILAHSMGSIIAYDVLREINGAGGETAAVGTEVECLATLGSPLGFTYVKGRILAEAKGKFALRTPPCIRRAWLNFADRADPVALDAHLADDYAPNDRGVRVRDILVCNDYQPPGRRRNPHKSYGYLRAPAVSEAIASFL